MAIMLCPYCDRDRASNDAIRALETKAKTLHVEYHVKQERIGNALERAGLCGCLYLYDIPFSSVGGNMNGVTALPSLDHYDQKSYGWAGTITPKRK